MKEKVRLLTLKIADGNMQALPVLYNIHRFTYHEKILQFLFDNGFTGNNFMSLYKERFRGSWLELGRWAVKKINKEKGRKPIVYGRDWL